MVVFAPLFLVRTAAHCWHCALGASPRLQARAVLNFADPSYQMSAADRAAHIRSTSNGELTTVDEVMDGLEDLSLTVSVQQLLANDHAADGSKLTLSAVGGAQHGSVSLGTNGTVTFTPEAQYSGQASFDYFVSAETGPAVKATAYIDIAAVNDLPVFGTAALHNNALWSDMGVKRTLADGVTPDTASDADYAVSHRLPSHYTLGSAAAANGIVPFAMSVRQESYSYTTPISGESGGGELVTGVLDIPGMIGFKGGQMFWGSNLAPGGSTNIQGWSGQVATT